MVRYNEMISILMNTIIELRKISDTSSNIISRKIKSIRAINKSKRSIKRLISKKNIFTSEDILSFAQFIVIAKDTYKLNSVSRTDCFMCRHFVTQYGNDYGGNSTYGEIDFVIPYSEYQSLKTTIGVWIEESINNSFKSISAMDCKWAVSLIDKNNCPGSTSKDYEFTYSSRLMSLEKDEKYGHATNEFIDISNKMLYNIFSIGIERVYSSLIERFVK